MSQVSDAGLRGVDKIALYGWTTKNEPGTLVFVHKGSLAVDQTYQRKMNDSKRLRIASAFNWAAFGVLIVARRPDGSLWVIDGQHRLAAAQSRSDIEMVPVIIFDFKGEVADEATDFLIANRDRRPLDGIESFRALLVSGDPIAVQVNEMLERSGKVIAKNAHTANSIRCVRALTYCMTKDARTMRAIWPLIVELAGEAVIDMRLVFGMFELERRLIDAQDNPRSLTEKDHQSKLIVRGHAAVTEAIGKAAAYYNKGGQVVYAKGILNLLNHGKKNKLRIRGDAEPVE
jgi:hypothetical protein